MKVCAKCERNLDERSFELRSDRPGQYRRECRDCRNYSEFRLDSGCIPFGTPIERASAESLIAHGNLVKAALALQLEPRQLRAHLTELKRRAARSGYAPGSDMTKVVPEGFGVKGVSTYYRIDPATGENKPSGQWVKTSRDEDHKYAALLTAMESVADSWTGKATPSDEPTACNDDLLCVYPMGDPHLGMFAWAPETGADFDLSIAESTLCDAVDQLVAGAPPAREALIINLGDFFHADNKSNTTTRSHHALDVDTRWAKVMRVGVRTMRRCIDRALEKHAIVRVICEIGNHDDHASIMLALCLSQYYEREPRVIVDTSPAKFHWLRFGATLIGVTHGDTVKPDQLPGIMACDRKEDWGQTEYRYWYTGHIHHDTLKEYPGVIVETFRTLAPRDAWHAGQGYRSGQDMKVDVIDRRFGRITRNTVGVRQLRTP